MLKRCKKRLFKTYKMTIDNNTVTEKHFISFNLI